MTTERHGSRPRPPESTPNRRPPGLDDDTVAALGTLSEALETVERARGALYSFHQLSGHADLLLDQAVEALEAAGHPTLARRISDEVIGRNVIDGRWTFQIVEEYDDGYHADFVAVERAAREELAGGARHLFESEMKDRRRTPGRPGHEARPPAAHDPSVETTGA